MFSKMISKFKNGDDSDKKNSELIEKIAKMNLSDMRAYMKNTVQGQEPSEEGIIEILRRLTTLNETTSKRYLETDDMDSKTKNGFELILVIASDKRITIDAIELIQEFIDMYSDIILNYDTKHKQIYGSKLKKSITNAILTVSNKADFSRKQMVLNN